MRRPCWLLSVPKPLTLLWGEEEGCEAAGPGGIFLSWCSSVPTALLQAGLLRQAQRGPLKRNFEFDSDKHAGASQSLDSPQQRYVEWMLAPRCIRATGHRHLPEPRPQAARLWSMQPWQSPAPQQTLPSQQTRLRHAHRLAMQLPNRLGGWLAHPRLRQVGLLQRN